MKLNVDVKKKKVDVEANVEKLVEKGMDNHEKDWKEKFSVKHNAKKELLKLKHEQKVELNDSNNTKKIGFRKFKKKKEKRKNWNCHTNKD